MISIEEAKRAKLNPIPSQTSVKQVPVKLEHPVNKIIETANSRSAKPRLSDGVSLFSASHKKVYDKPSGKSGSAFTEKNFLRNVAHMSLEAEKTKKERESREAMRKLDFHAIINLAESNVKLNKKKPGEEPTKRRLADPPNFDAKSFKIPKKETTSKPHNIPIVKNKEAGRTTESAKQAHLSVSVKYLQI